MGFKHGCLPSLKSSELRSYEDSDLRAIQEDHGAIGSTSDFGMPPITPVGVTKTALRPLRRAAAQGGESFACTAGRRRGVVIEIVGGCSEEVYPEAPK